jgi:hypothetical protein
VRKGLKWRFNKMLPNSMDSTAVEQAPTSVLIGHAELYQKCLVLHFTVYLNSI